MNRLPLFAAAALAALCSCRGRPSVVVYVSEDQVFSEPILRDFEKDTGISVQAVYDTEEAKSTGVMNRLLAEGANPRADVYWANEPVRAELLKQEGIAAPYRSPAAEGIPPQYKDPEGHWTGFSARARYLVVHRSVKDKPDSIRAYTDPKWKGKAVIANPLFGTTTAEVAALFTLWGDAAARKFLEALKANEVRLATSNGETADLVASGQYSFGLVDSDDGYSRIQQRRPLEIVYPDQEAGGLGCMIVPNAVVLIRNGPHPEAGRKLVDYLLSPETERKLAISDAAQIPLHPRVPAPPHVPQIERLRAMPIDYAAVARKMTEIQPYLKSWTGR